MIQKALFGAGCFWGVQEYFRNIPGILETKVGYSGGKTNNPTYESVCSGNTGHAEVCKISFNPDIISFEELLSVFFQTHDSTTLNRQGADTGTQYRSGIFYIDDSQKLMAEKFIKKLINQEAFKDSIVTEVTKLDIFYEAENYHQDYYGNNKNAPYCRAVIKPKLDKFLNNDY